MKKPLSERISYFMENTVIPLAFIGAGLVGGGYFCFQNHRLENVVVQESEKDCGTDELFGEFCWEEIEVSNHWKCLYQQKGHLEPSTKIEYLIWERGLRLPLLECDMVLEYKISGEENIYR
jgi:hypothetical protein